MALLLQRRQIEWFVCFRESSISHMAIFRVPRHLPRVAHGQINTYFWQEYRVLHKVVSTLDVFKIYMSFS